MLTERATGARKDSVQIAATNTELHGNRLCIGISNAFVEQVNGLTEEGISSSAVIRFVQAIDKMGYRQ